MQKDPKEPREFACTDDAPTNNGNGSEERDWEEIRPPGKLRNMYDPEEENPDADDFDNGDWGEQFD